MKKNLTLTFKYIVVIMLLLVTVMNIPCNVVYADEEEAETVMVEETVETIETIEEEVVEEIKIEETIEVSEVVEIRKPVELALHDECFNKHVTEVKFVDENGNVISSKKLISDSAVPLPGQGVYSTKSYTDENGNIHNFLGWFKEDGTLVQGPERGYYSYSECKTVIITAKWEIEVHNPALLQHNYIDLVSDGTGYFSNEYAPISSYEHIFNAPAEVNGFTFVGWTDENGNLYQANDVYSYDCSNLKNDDVVTINHYALWQPWLTINIYNEDELVSSFILKNSDDAFAYDFDELSFEKAGKTFNGFVDEEGNKVSGMIEMAMPEIISQSVEENVVNFYADYTMNIYTIRFVDYDGSLISEAEYNYGDQLIDIPENLIRKSDGKYSYKFIGWNKEVEEIVTEDREYIAQYSQTMIVVPAAEVEEVKEDVVIPVVEEVEEVKEEIKPSVVKEAEVVEEVIETMPMPAVGNTGSIINVNTMMVILLVVSVVFILHTISSDKEDK